MGELLTPERRELVERMAAVAPAFAERAAKYDREASFPTENWDDLRAAGLLSLCVPVEHGGLGADFAGYALVAEELGRHCATTALTFNMHCATTMLVGFIADDLDHTVAERELLETRRAVMFAGIVDGSTIHAQPFSEGVAPGATAGIGTRARPVEGGYRVTGKKIFASLSGAADIHNIVAHVEGDPRVRLLGVPADAEGVHIEGDWDPLGMRGTDSRNLVMDAAFVPESNEWVPPGTFDQAAQRWPYFYMTLSFAYLGLTRAILDFTAAYLRGEHGTPPRRDNHVKQAGWARMNLVYERCQALTYRVLAEAGVDPGSAAVRRAWSAMVTTMEGAPEVASLAIQVCGGRSMLRPNPLERHYRDARCGATMLPWSVEVCLDRLGRADLFGEDESPAWTATGTEWRWVRRYADQFAQCQVGEGQTAVVLHETTSRPSVVATARLALEHLGAHVVDLCLTTPANAGPLPIRSTGASQAIAGHRSALAALHAADFVADCTVEGLLHAPELGEILSGGARVLMISNEHPENVERWPVDPGLADRVARGVALLGAASTMKVSSPAGTDLTVSLGGGFIAGSHGWCTEAGSIAHWPGGLVLAFPAAGTVAGRVVLAPGDVNLTFKNYLRSTVALTIAEDHIVSIDGDGLDSELFASYLEAFDEPEAFAVSHVGWGMNTAARWESLAMWDKADLNGTELRAFAGNFLYSTGANEVAGRYCRGHFDLPMRNCTITLDEGEPVVRDGVLRPDLAP